MGRCLPPIRAGALAFAVLAACERGTEPRIPEQYPAMQLVHIVAGDEHTCGIGTDSLAYCWGSDNIGRTVADSCSSGLVCSAIPGPVAGGHRFVALTADQSWFGLDCGLTASGAAYCWGEVGWMDVTVWGSVVPVPYATTLQFSALSSGGRHTCGLDLQRHIWCWGENFWAQLSTGVWDGTEDPQLVAGEAIFTFLSAGRTHTCAGNEAGQLLCWGDNTDGQLGSGLPVEDLGCGWYTGDRCEANPRGVHGGWVFTAVGAGWYHTCGVTAGTLACWGANGAGQLGATTSQHTCPVRGEGTQPCAPYPVHVGFPLPSSDLQVTAVAAGGAHTCALTATGTAYCWGANDHGQLGIGASGNRAAPTPVAAEGIAFHELTAGHDHTCGIATDGDAYCWGNNSDGQLGDGTTTDRWAPVRVRRPGP